MSVGESIIDYLVEVCCTLFSPFTFTQRKERDYVSALLGVSGKFARRHRLDYYQRVIESVSAG